MTSTQRRESVRPNLAQDKFFAETMLNSMSGQLRRTLTSGAIGASAEIEKMVPVVPHPILPANASLADFLKTHGHANGNGLFYMGHASIMVVLSGKKILFDPIVLSKPYGDAWAFYPPQVLDPALFEVDAVVISHIHQDHYDTEYLKCLPVDVKIIIVGGRPSFENDLKSHGLNNIQIIPPEVVTEIFNGVSIFGVLHETNCIDASTLIFNDNFCIYHGNDNYLQADSMRKFSRLGRVIDVACIPYAYIHWYPFLMDYGPGQKDIKLAEEARLVNLYMDDCLNMSGILNAKLVIPFGANLLLDDGNAYSDMNIAVKTPVEFAEYATIKAPELEKIVRPMLAGDFCVPTDGGELELTIKGASGGKAYRAAADRFLKSRAQIKEEIVWPEIDKSAFMQALNEKICHFDVNVDNVIRIETNFGSEVLKVEVDCRKLQACWVDVFTANIDFHQFTLDPVSSGMWLSGRRFEEVIGTRRFRVRREPNVYSKDVLRLLNTLL